MPLQKDHAVEFINSGNDDHRDMPVAVIGFQPGEHLEPVDPGHHNIQQHQIGSFFPHGLNSVQSI